MRKLIVVALCVIMYAGAAAACDTNASANAADRGAGDCGTEQAKPVVVASGTGSAVEPVQLVKAVDRGAQAEAKPVSCDVEPCLDP